MTCEHPGCSFDVFSSCINHCTKNLCLEHSMEHGDIFLKDFTKLLDNLDQSTRTLMSEANDAVKQITQRRQYEIDYINRVYNEEQIEIRKRLKFAETANDLLKEKQHLLTSSREQNECLIGQHDFQQVKFYVTHIKSFSDANQIKEETSEEKFEIRNDSSSLNEWEQRKCFPCPLNRPNVFGIKPEHNIRYDCVGTRVRKHHLVRHFENFHRMLPECALRLKNAVINNQSSDETILFSHDEIIFNTEFLVACPITDSTNIFGAQPPSNSLKNTPCTKKKLARGSIMKHLLSYHRMNLDAAKTIFNAMQNKSLSPDLILFDKNYRIGTSHKRW